MNITIREATKINVLLLSELSTQTFYETYATFNTKENMESYVKNNFAVEALEKNFDEPNARFFIAYADEMPVGYAKLRTVEVPEAMRNRNHLELERIYVKQDFKGMKIGKKLISKSIEVAKQKGFEVLWLGVWEHNEKALAFYKKMGFEIFDEHIFKLGNDEQRDYLMKRELR